MPYGHTLFRWGRRFEIGITKFHCISYFLFLIAQGLGMRIVGGTCGPDGVLGAYVTLVIKGGPADTHGLCEGKPIQINMYADGLCKYSGNKKASTDCETCYQY